MTDHTYTTDHEREAFELGAAAGLAAASWVADGNTSPDHFARVLAMMDDGDPQAYDYLPTWPNLSGEWADSPTRDSLAGEIIGERIVDADDETAERLTDEIADAWEAGVASTFEAECERILRAMAPDPEDTSEERCTEHGFDECPDCGNVGIKMNATGYVPCTRFLSCWTDPEPERQPAVCAGTGNHNGQGIEDCDECNPAKYEHLA